MPCIEKYEYTVSWDEKDNIFIGRVSEFKLLAAHGDTPIGALDEIKKVVSLVVEDLCEEGEEIPPPFSQKNYSGKLNIRIPKDLHRELAKSASKNEISLNQYIIYKLSQ